jgi:ribonucleoside-diphosphate reductase alpha chain
MKDTAIERSIELADERGSARGWKDSMWDKPYLSEWRKRMGRTGPYSPVSMRNLFLLTQAPTGTTSLLAGVNSGIEPYFNLKTWRNDRMGGKWVYAKAVGGIADESFLETALPPYVVTSREVPVEEHIAIQAAVQRWCDSSVSKTINAPNSQTVEEVEKAFTLAYDSGLKGIAYYRDGSRNVQVLYHENPNDRIKELEDGEGL